MDSRGAFLEAQVALRSVNEARVSGKGVAGRKANTFDHVAGFMDQSREPRPNRCWLG
jgi:hypothetical protein